MKPSISLDCIALKQAFNRAAPAYAEYGLLSQEIAARLFDRLDVIKVQPEIVVDLGCSTGYCTVELAQRFPNAQIIGIDFAEQMLNFATSGININYQCENAEHTSLADQSIDFVFANLLLHWCDMKALFAEVKRVLKPNGLLLFSTLGPDTLQELRYCWRQVDKLTHVHQFTDMHDIGDLLLEMKFADPVMDMEFLTTTFPDAESLMYSLKMAGAHNVNVNRPKHLMGKQKLEKVVEAYEQFRDEDNLIPATFEVIYGHAWQPDLSQRQSIDADGHAHIPINLIKIK